MYLDQIISFFCYRSMECFQQYALKLEGTHSVVQPKFEKNVPNFYLYPTQTKAVFWSHQPPQWNFSFPQASSNHYHCHVPLPRPNTVRNFGTNQELYLVSMSTNHQSQISLLISTSEQWFNHVWLRSTETKVCKANNFRLEKIVNSNPDWYKTPQPSDLL